MSLYFPGRDNTRLLVYTLLKCEIYLVNGLPANLLIGNNIFSLEGFFISIGKKKALIKTCKVTIIINTKWQGQFFTKKLLTSYKSVVSPCLEAMISFIQIPLPNNREFFFYLAIQANLTLYTYIIDYEIMKILVKNPSD